MGDRDHAFEWLERAYAERSGTLEYIKTDDSFVPFHSDPRYIDLLKRMGFPADGPEGDASPRHDSAGISWQLETSHREGRSLSGQGGELQCLDLLCLPDSDASGEKWTSQRDFPRGW